MRVLNDALLRLFVWIKDEKAQTMAEYGLILALVSVAAIIILGTVGGSVKNVFTSVANNLKG